MRVVKALKSLIMNYFQIMPIFILATFITTFIANIAPVIGMILLLPLLIGVAYSMLKAITKSKQFKQEALLVGFKSDVYFKNVTYLLIKQFAYLIPLIIGFLIIGYFYRYVHALQINYGILISNLIIFSIPATIISLMFTFVPHLLADPKFNQKRHNPLKVSALMMRGNYLRLLLMRLLFVPWFIWFTSGFLVSVMSVYQSLFGGEFAYPNLALSWMISLPINYLVIQPWYLMMHAEFYVSLRGKLNHLT